MSPPETMEMDDATLFDRETSEDFQSEEDLASSPTMMQQMEGVERVGRYELH